MPKHQTDDDVIVDGASRIISANAPKHHAQILVSRSANLLGRAVAETQGNEVTSSSMIAESQIGLTRRTGTIIEIDVCNEQNARLN